MIETLQSHYGFTVMPFTAAIPVTSLFGSAAHKEAVARLRWLISARGLGVLTGEVGSGKTAACPAPSTGWPSPRSWPPAPPARPSSTNPPPAPPSARKPPRRQTDHHSATQSTTSPARQQPGGASPHPHVATLNVAVMDILSDG
jgi:hypothetical protein